MFFSGTTAWLRDRGEIGVPVVVPGHRLEIIGTVVDYSKEFPTSVPFPGLRVKLNGKELGAIWPVRAGAFLWQFPLPGGGLPEKSVVTLELDDVYWSNWLAWLGRVTKPLKFLPSSLYKLLQEYRLQRRNRSLALEALRVDGKELINFRLGHLTPARPFVQQSWKPGLNVIGHFRAALGVAEMARCMVRAADAVQLPTALVELKINCLNSRNDDSFTARLQEENPYPINVFHLDAPQAEEIEHHHGKAFRQGRYNIGFWAWELTDFPDSRVRHHRLFDEIWCLSDFARTAIAAKLPKPVLTMPLAIDFPIPRGDFRAKFGLPARKFLFLFIYDLNSTQERKNPQAVIAAFKRAFPNPGSAGLVIKTHNPGLNPAEFAELQAQLADLPDAHLICDTLPRETVLELQQACDCFVSLHRAEGFGLGLAEAMFLGKPVISTDWSATTEFVTAANGFPIRYQLKTLERDHGPYARGQTWADADVEHAAHAMRQVVSDSALAQRLGQQGAADIRRLFSPAAIGRRYRQRLDAFSLW
ncbi:MAG: glycosyltransferase family 4 protein [Opitutae bacterium]|nr:glycosyltransferase family 4 protein [Opitutae bacterium]